MEYPTSMINIDLDKFTNEIGIPMNQFKAVLKSEGGPFENGKIKYSDAKPEVMNFAAPSNKSIDDGSAAGNDDASESTAKKKTKKQTYWKPDEDLMLKVLFEKHGKNWGEIQKSFPDKTTDQIHNHIRFLKKSGKLDLIGTKDYEDKKRKKVAAPKPKAMASSKASMSGKSLVSKDNESKVEPSEGQGNEEEIMPHQSEADGEGDNENSETRLNLKFSFRRVDDGYIAN